MRIESIVSELALSSALLAPCEIDASTPAWRSAESDGWDMNLVALRLRQPVQERIRRHNLALRQAEAMRAAFRSQYERFGLAR